MWLGTSDRHAEVMAHSAYDIPRPRSDEHDEVACRGAEADLWFASHPVAVERAKTLCRACPIRLSCLDDATRRREPWGVWGGELFENGEVVVFKRPRGRPRKDAAKLAS